MRLNAHPGESRGFLLVGRMRESWQGDNDTIASFRNRD